MPNAPFSAREDLRRVGQAARTTIFSFAWFEYFAVESGICYLGFFFVEERFTPRPSPGLAPAQPPSPVPTGEGIILWDVFPGWRSLTRLLRANIFRPYRAGGLVALLII